MKNWLESDEASWGVNDLQDAERIAKSRSHYKVDQCDWRVNPEDLD